MSSGLKNGGFDVINLCRLVGALYRHENVSDVCGCGAITISNASRSGCLLYTLAAAGFLLRISARGRSAFTLSDNYR